MFPATPHPGVLLIADDDEDMRMMFRTLMTARGHQVREACDGVECVAMVASAMPDLVILDLRMPGMDGLEVAMRLRAEPATHRLPLLAVTAMADREMRMQALEAGCNDVLVKPFSPRALLARVEELLAETRDGRARTH
jgi:CheY-like chemotaxis protein